MARLVQSVPPSLLAVSLTSGEVRYVQIADWHGRSPRLDSISGATGKPAGEISREQVAELIGPVTVTFASREAAWQRSA